MRWMQEWTKGKGREKAEGEELWKGLDRGSGCMGGGNKKGKGEDE